MRALNCIPDIADLMACAEVIGLIIEFNFDLLSTTYKIFFLIICPIFSLFFIIYDKCLLYLWVCNLFWGVGEFLFEFFNVMFRKVLKVLKNL